MARAAPTASRPAWSATSLGSTTRTATRPSTWPWCPRPTPSRIPNLLVTGAGGIAVGMATNIPPHNLGEIVDACLAIVDNPDLPLEELLEIVPGPDFPTGGEIIGRSGARQALMTGSGSVIVRGTSHVEELRKEREAIIITSLPYQVNKAELVKRIGELVREERVEGGA